MLALDPYIAAAAAPFITSILSTSFMLISTSLFCAPPPKSINWRESLFTITPSIMYKGSDEPAIVLGPLNLTDIPPAGLPEF